MLLSLFRLKYIVLSLFLAFFDFQLSELGWCESVLFRVLCFTVCGDKKRGEIDTWGDASCRKGPTAFKNRAFLAMTTVLGCFFLINLFILFVFVFFR